MSIAIGSTQEVHVHVHVHIHVHVHVHVLFIVCLRVCIVRVWCIRSGFSFFATNLASVLDTCIFMYSALQ